MSDETTLLPCPFCGGEARMRRVDFPDGDAEYVFDCACGRKIFETASKAKAVTAWNTRAEFVGEREKELEQLVRDMYEQWAYSIDGYYRCLLANYRKRMAELGLEVSR